MEADCVFVNNDEDYDNDGPTPRGGRFFQTSGFGDLGCVEVSDVHSSGGDVRVDEEVAPRRESLRR